MRRTIAAVLAATFAFPAAARAATIAWSGAGDGTRWHDASNWLPPAGSSTPRVPVGSDDVVIAAPANATIRIDVQPASARTLAASGAERLLIQTSLALADTDTTSTILVPVTIGPNATLTTPDPLELKAAVLSDGGIIDGLSEGELIIEDILTIQKPAALVRGIAVNNATVTCAGGAEWFAGDVQLSDQSFFGSAAELIFPAGTTLRIGPGGMMAGGFLRLEEGSFLVQADDVGEPRIDTRTVAQGATFGLEGGAPRLLMSNVLAGSCDIAGVTFTDSESLASPTVELVECRLRDVRVEKRGTGLQAGLNVRITGETQVDGLVVHTTSVRPDVDMATVEVLAGSTLRAENFGDPANSEVTIDNGRIVGAGALEVEAGAVLDVADTLDAPGTQNLLSLATSVFGEVRVPRFFKLTDPTGATTPRVRIEKGGLMVCERESAAEISVDCFGAIEIGDVAASPAPRSGEPDPDRVAFATHRWQVQPGGTVTVAPKTEWRFLGSGVTDSSHLEVLGGGTVRLGDASELTVVNGNLLGELLAEPSSFFTVSNGRFRVRNGSIFEPEDIEIIGGPTDNFNESADPELVTETPFTWPRLRLDGDCNLAGPPVTVTEFLSMKGGELKVAGDFTLAAGATALFNGEFASTSGMAVRIGNGTRLMNRGSITWTSTFAPIFRTTATASFVSEGTMLLDTNDSTFGAGPFINRGTIEKIGSVSQPVLRGIRHESGLIENRQGRLVIDGGELLAEVRTLEPGRTSGSNGVRLAEGCAITGEGNFGIDADVFVDADVPAGSVAMDRGAGVLRGAGALLVSNEFLWFDGDINMSSTGELVILPGATLLMEPSNFDGFNNFWLGGVIENFGTAIWSAAGNASIVAEAPAAFNNRDTGQFLVQGRERLFFPANAANRIAFLNEGTLVREPAPALRGETGPDETGLGCNLVNSGVITLESGLARVEGTFTQSGGALNFEGGSLQHLGIDQNGAPVLQSTPLQFTGGAINVNAPGTVMGEVRIGPDTEVLVSGTAWIIAGRFGIEGAMTVLDGKVVHFAQGLDGFPSPQEEPALYDGSLLIQPGILAIGSELFGDVVFTPQSFVDAADNLLIGGGFEGLGHMKLTAAVKLRHFGRGAAGGALALGLPTGTAPQDSPAIYGGVIDVENGGGTISGETVFEESAIVTLAGAPLTVEGPLTIEGQLNLDGGTLTNKGRTPEGDPTDQAAPIVLRSATVQATADSEIDGDMTLEGAANQFVIKPGVTLTAAVTQLDLTSAQLTLETVSAPTPRAGKLKARRRNSARGAGGEIVLGGTFTLSFVGAPGVPMPPGTTFRAVEAESLTGAFAEVNGLEVPGGTFTTSQGATFFDLILGGGSGIGDWWAVQ